MKATINSDKHYFQTPVVQVASGTRLNINVVTVDNALVNASDVRVGAVVKAVYLEYWVDGDTASKTVQAMFQKRPSGVDNISYAEMQNLGAYDNKKNILEHHEGLAPSGGNVLPLFRGWMSIPKGKQRMGLGDNLTVSVAATATDVNLCGFATFKEYF